VRLGFLLKGSLLDVNQGVHIKRLLYYCEAVSQLVQFVDLRRECRFDPGKLVPRHYQEAVGHVYRRGINVSVRDAM
jgi:hypothetical protein